MVLRAALTMLGQHDARSNPLTFAVFYEHLAGINTKLSRAIDECLKIKPRLDDEAIAQLYHEHVSEVDEPAMRRASGELERVMSGMAESAGKTGDKAGAFGQTLTGLEVALKG